MDLKPGWKTTEFWITLATALVGLGLVTYGAVQKDEAIMKIGGTLAAAGAGGYAVSRGLAK